MRNERYQFLRLLSLLRQAIYLTSRCSVRFLQCNRHSVCAEWPNERDRAGVVGMEACCYLSRKRVGFSADMLYSETNTMSIIHTRTPVGTLSSQRWYHACDALCNVRYRGGALMPSVTIAEIDERLRHLPPEKLTVVYDFVSYLLAR